MSSASSSYTAEQIEQLTKDVLAVWFPDLNDDQAPGKQHYGIWYGKDASFDAMLSERFGSYVAAARDTHQLDSMLHSKDGALAYVILLDQMSRNIYRGSPNMFAADVKCQQVVARLITEQHYDAQLSPVKASFLYLPLMHAESSEVQRQSIAKYEQLKTRCANTALASFAESCLKYAHDHADVIFKFDRYPSRNAILQRETTQEESEFLKTHQGW